MRIERCAGVYEPDDDSYLLMGIEEIKGRVVEVGCGTGIVGLSYAEKGASVTLIDISAQAVACARRNARMNGMDVSVIRGDMFQGLRGKFDYCIFNPPYLPSSHPDDDTWTGGPRGYEVTERFLRDFPRLSRNAFYIESSLSPIARERFGNLEFSVERRMRYEFEELDLVRVTVNGFDR